MTAENGPDENKGVGTGTDEGAEATARVLADVDSYLAQADVEQRGALWRLTEASRQLDANLVRLPPDAQVDVHREPDVDVLVVVVAGGGTIHAESGPVSLSAHTLAWLPRGSSRSIAAGSDGLAYLTVHRARTGMRIRPAGG